MSGILYSEAASIAIEGPPGSGKTTHCERLYAALLHTSDIVVVPELLAVRYNCGESDRFHDLQSVSKERFALALRRGGFSVLMDRCRISTVIMRLTQVGAQVDLAAYRAIERAIFGDHSLSVARLELMSTTLPLCRRNRRGLQDNESRVDMQDDFFARLHDNYHYFFTLAETLYPDAEIVLHERTT